jgi:hypothetical protein
MQSNSPSARHIGIDESAADTRDATTDARVARDRDANANNRGKSCARYVAE